MNKKLINVMLIGAPNCGKSTLFNRLTHANAPVGNRAGVTVDKTVRILRRGYLGHNCPDIMMYDLPGIHSLSLYNRSADEEVTISTLRDGKPDLIINVLGASTLERCLALTAAIRTEYPHTEMLCAVNMYDELEHEGISLDFMVLYRLFGVKFVGVSAACGSGLSALRSLICEAVKRVEDNFKRKDDNLSVPKNKRQNLIPNIPCSESGRAAYVSYAASSALSKPVKAHKPTDIADRFLTHPAVGIPLFIVIMSLIFWMTFGPFGNILTFIFEKITISPLGTFFDFLSLIPGFPVTLSSFLNECILGGVGSVISFLPRITLLFILLALIEDSGYMARASFIMDAHLSCAGLSGRAFVPILLGFGCSVTAVMSTRTLGDRRERLRCILFLPLISCSARAPIYSVIASSFFPRVSWIAVTCVYLSGIVVFLISSGIMRTASGAAVPMFITELPRYRFPRIRVTLPAAAARAKEFLIRAGGVIFLSTAIIWLLSSLTPRFTIAFIPEQSILARLAGFISPLFAPLGFGNWQAAAALLAGIGAKEGVLSALGVLTGGNPSQTLAGSGIFTPASALSFMVFSSMYIPCAATIPLMRSESGSLKYTVAGIAIMFISAYLLSLSVYLCACMLNGQ